MRPGVVGRGNTHPIFQLSAEAIQCPVCGSSLEGESVDGLCPHCLARQFLGGEGEDYGKSDADVFGARLGGYELLREIGRGGMGIIYEARQVSLNRPVAVKTIANGRLANAEAFQRFQAEAMAAAKLKHPNIVSVIEVGDSEGQPFFSMNLVDGRDLGEIIREALPSSNQVAEWISSIAEAIAAAHEAGIIHRDLKPTNILIESGSGEPIITDFGLAKEFGSDEGLTKSGAVIGTPHYMPPEQLCAGRDVVGYSADVYSLGAVLYHLLTGRPPFIGETIQSILAQVQSADPVDPRRLNPRVPKDLETICLKCLEKDPARRYPSARELSEDLSRFRQGCAIVARPISGAERLTRWCGRNPLLAFACSAALLFLLVGVSGILWQWGRAEKLADNEQILREEAEHSLRELQLSRAEDLFQSGDPSGGIAHLSHLLRADPNNLAVARRLLSELTYQRFVIPTDPSEALPRGRQFKPVHRSHDEVLSLVCDGNVAMVRSHPGEKQIGNIRVQGDIQFAQLGSMAQTLTTVSGGDKISVFRLGEDTPFRSWQLPDEEIFHLQLSDDDNTILVRTRSGKVAVWDVVSNRQLSLHDFGRSVELAMLSGDGKWFVTSSGNSLSHAIQLWRSDLQEPLNRPMQCAGQPIMMARGRTDDTLAVVTRNGYLEIWATPSCVRIAQLRHRSAIQYLTQGAYNLMTTFCDANGEMTVWPALSSGLPPFPVQRNREVSKIYGTNDGSRVIALTSERFAYVHSTLHDEIPHVPIRLAELPTTLSGTADNRTLAIQGERRISLFDLKKLPALGRLLQVDIDASAQSDSGLLVTSVSGGRELKVWDANSENSALTLTNLPGATTAIAIDAQSGTVAAAFADKSVWIWRLIDSDDRVSADRKATFRTNRKVHALAIDPKGRYLFSSHSGGIVRCSNLQTGERITQPHEIVFPDRGARLMRIDSLGRHLVVSWFDQTQVFEVATGAPVGEPILHSNLPNAVAMNPEGTVLALAPHDSQVALYRLHETSTESRLVLQSGIGKAIAFSADGRKLAIGSVDRRATVWELGSNRQVGKSLIHDSEVHVLRFAEDTKTLITGTAEGSLRAWDVESGVPISGKLSQQGRLHHIVASSNDEGTVLAMGDHLRSWWLPTTHRGKAPAWLAPLAEAFGRQVLLDDGTLQFAENLPRKIVADAVATETNDSWHDWLQFIDDATGQRPIHPSASIGLDDYVSFASERENSIWLEEARRVAPHMSAVLKKLVRRPFVSRDSESRELFDAAHAGTILLDNGDGDEGIAILTAAALLSLKQKEAARAAYQKSPSEGRNSECVVLLNRGRVLGALGNYEEAYTSFGAAYETGKESPKFDGFCREALLERRALGIRMGEPAEAVMDYLNDRGISARDPATPESCIDLSAYYTASLGENWHGRHWKGQNLAVLPQGARDLQGVIFDLRGIVQLKGLSLELNAPGYPEQILGIQIGKQAQQLHFLHALGWGEFSHQDSHIADYVVHYTDGTEERIRLINGVNIQEWVVSGDTKLTSEQVSLAWSGTNARNNRVGLFKKSWTNPHPELEIESIDFLSTGTNAAPFLVALTAK